VLSITSNSADCLRRRERVKGIRGMESLYRVEHIVPARCDSVFAGLEPLGRPLARLLCDRFCAINETGSSKREEAEREID